MMKEKEKIGGRSLVLNSVLVLLNVIAVVLLVLGGHDNFSDQAVTFNVIGGILLLASIGGIILFKGRLMISSFSRILVGGLFIVSGLVKANDPIGFSYKLEEYFEDGALAFRIKEWFGAPSFSMEFLMEYALGLSIFICIAEIVLGVLTLIGGKIKLVSYSIVGLMAFFTFLTWHTANCDNDHKFLDRDTYEITDPLAQIMIERAESEESITIHEQTATEVTIDEMRSPQCVDDCGCFGDALKGSVGRSLTPKESLWKDLILLYFSIWIFVAQWKITPNNKKENVIYLVGGMVVIGFFSWVFGWYFPLLFGAIAVVGSLWVLRVGGKNFGNHYVSAFFVAFLCSLFILYVMNYEPLKDYRPYAIGSDLREKMNDGIPEESMHYYMITDLETNTKERIQFDKIDPEVWSNKEKWKADFDGTDVLVEGRNPSIMDFKPFISVSDLDEDIKSLEFVQNKIEQAKVQQLRFLVLEDSTEMLESIETYDPEFFPETEYELIDTVEVTDPDFTDVEILEDLLELEKVVIIVSKRLTDGTWDDVATLKEIQKACQEEDVPFLMICNATPEDIMLFKEQNGFSVPTFVLDEIELKIIARSNPALLLLEKGVVTAKYSQRGTPSVENFTKEHLKEKK